MDDPYELNIKNETKASHIIWDSPVFNKSSRIFKRYNIRITLNHASFGSVMPDTSIMQLDTKIGSELPSNTLMDNLLTYT